MSEKPQKPQKQNTFEEIKSEFGKWRIRPVANSKQKPPKKRGKLIRI